MIGQGEDQIAVGVYETRFQRNRLAVAGNRLRHLPLFLQALPRGYESVSGKFG